jgi:polyhydroxyalkanoate synthesis regulator phasin
MNEQRKQILDMLVEGKINADEAERLIAALERDTGDASSASDEPRPTSRLKFLRVVVDDRSKDEPAKVNVRVPIQLLRAGVKLASLIPPQALGQANERLARSGFPIDLTQLKPEQIEDLIEHLRDFTVDVEEKDAKVHVFCE